MSTTATPISPVSGSPYAIAIAQGTLSATNYTFNLVPGALTVTQIGQYITFYPLPTITQASVAFPLTAQASSGLPVTYTFTGPASITNNLLTVTGPGTVTVTANQAGNPSYAPATAVVRSFTAQ